MSSENRGSSESGGSSRNSDSGESSVVTVTEASQLHRYEAYVDGVLAGFAEYVDHEGAIQKGVVREIPHTETFPQFGGRGVASAVARHALDDIRSRAMAVRPSCPFIAEYIARHPEYADLAG